MIPTTDLRIGNCYTTGLEVIGSREAKLNMSENRAIKLTLNHFYIFSQANELIQCLQPIKLTESILLQCGFDKNRIEYIIENFVLNAQIDGTFEFYYSYENGRNEFNLSPDLKYLHQLQNLYYSLTGKELPIDINTLKI